MLLEMYITLSRKFVECNVPLQNCPKIGTIRELFARFPRNVEKRTIAQIKERISIYYV